MHKIDSGNETIKASTTHIPFIPIKSDLDFIKKEIDSDDEIDTKIVLGHAAIEEVPSFDLPWLPKIVSVYSEAYSDAGLSSEMGTDEELFWQPKMTSVCSEASDINIHVISTVNDTDLVKNENYRTSIPIEECPWRKRSDSKINLKRLRFV